MSITLKYPHLFSPIQLGKCTFQNRIIAAPMLEMGVFSDGAPTEKAAAFYGRRAQGGAAAVTLGESQVNHDLAIARTQTLCLRSIDGKEDPFRRVVTAIRRHGALASIQLLHAGMASKIATIDPVGQGVTQAYGPSAATRRDGIPILEMSKEMIAQIAKDFAICAANAKVLGFDMIQIHAGHGWIFSQFASPLVNHRTDEYGGSPENRARFARQVLTAIREKVGPDLLIEYRISGDDMQEGGAGIDDNIRIIQQIEDLIDIVHISAGTLWDPASEIYTFPLWFLPHGINVANASKMKAAVTKCKVSVVGGINDPAMAEEIIASGKADFVALNRPLLADPDWCRKAKAGLDETIRPCVRCLACHDRVDLTGFTCAVNPENGPEGIWNTALPKAAAPRKVVVIGGGVAGMQAALAAESCGHEVVLFEAGDELGGILNFARTSPIKKDLAGLLRYFIHTVQHSTIRLRLGERATPELVEAEHPDAVIAALGSVPMVPAIPGLRENACSVLDAYRSPERLGHHVVVIGGNLSGIELALDLAELGHEVTVLEMGDSVAAGAPHFYGAGIRKELSMYQDRVRCLTGTTCTAVTAEGAVVTKRDGEARAIPADDVVYAVGMKSRREEAEQFRCSALQYRAVGDCDRVARIKQAIENGFLAGTGIY